MRNLRQWDMDETGWVGQSLADMQDKNFSVFTETAKAHNTKINDAEQ